MTTSIVTDLRSYLRAGRGRRAFARSGFGQFKARDRRHLFAQLARRRPGLLLNGPGERAMPLSRRPAGVGAGVMRWRSHRSRSTGNGVNGARAIRSPRDCRAPGRVKKTS